MSPGWELNPRMSVLQTEALTTSPPGHEINYAVLYHYLKTFPNINMYTI